MIDGLTALTGLMDKTEDSWTNLTVIFPQFLSSLTTQFRFSSIRFALESILLNVDVPK